MKKIAFYLFLSLLTVFTFTRCDDDDNASPTEETKFKTFNQNMRKLWSDHGLWTRNVIINIVDGAPGTTEAVNRLLQNQVDIGDAIKPYYGETAGDALTGLLTEHINQAAGILMAAKSGDTQTFDSLSTAWYANGDAIAVFLNNANPDHFGLADWKAMMKNHLDLTLAEAVARLSGDYATDVATFDTVYNQLLMMADMLAEGIANQFPDKF
jgi:phage tail protein X